VHPASDNPGYAHVVNSLIFEVIAWKEPTDRKTAIVAMNSAFCTFLFAGHRKSNFSVQVAYDSQPL